MAAREAAQAERSRAEALAHDKAELQGRVRGFGLGRGVTLGWGSVLGLGQRLVQAMMGLACSANLQRCGLQAEAISHRRSSPPY